MRAPSPHLHSKKTQPIAPSPQHLSSPTASGLTDPNHPLGGKTIFANIYKAIHPKHHKAVKVPVVHVKKPHVAHIPKPKAAKKPHVVHIKKPALPKKPHIVHIKKPAVVHVKKVHVAKTPKAAHTVTPKHTLKRPKDQTPGALPTSHLNPNGTKGPGHIGKHDGPNPYRWSNHPAATMLDIHGHRSSAVAAAKTAAKSLKHAAGSSHSPKAHAAPKAPLQLNTDSFLGTDSHVQAHRPTPLVAPTVHLSPHIHY